MKALVFLLVAAAAVGAGVYLSKYAPVDEEPVVMTRRNPRRVPANAAPPSPGLVDTQVDTLKRSLDSLKNRQREMQQLLPEDERDPAALTKTDAADAIFKKDKSLDDYKKIIMEAVKSMSNFGKDITESTK